LLEVLAADPTLRGTLDALSSALMGVERKELKLDDMTRPSIAADTAEAILAGRPTSFSWLVLTSDDQAELRDLRRFIEIEPVLDFSALEPGRAATDAIARIVLDLKLTSDYQARVHQTGLIPIGDDEFGIIKQNAGLNATVSVLAVLGILWLALRSGRIMFAVVASITVGLVISTAWGLLLVGAQIGGEPDRSNLLAIVVEQQRRGDEDRDGAVVLRPQHAVETRDRTAALVHFAQDFVHSGVSSVQQSDAATDRFLGAIAEQALGALTEERHTVLVRGDDRVGRALDEAAQRAFRFLQFGIGLEGLLLRPAPLSGFAAAGDLVPLGIRSQG